MVNPIHNHLTIRICEDAADAIARGYDWGTNQSVKPIEVKEVIVIRKGTETGKATVDFVLEDETGQRFVFLITGALLRTIPC